MSLEILYVMDPMDSVSVEQDTTFVFQLEAQRRGHRNYHCLVHDLGWSEGRPFADVRPLRVQRKQGEHAELSAVERRRLDSFDCVMMRKDPPFDMQYVAATYLLERAGVGTFVMNRPRSLRDANEKLYSLRFEEWIPPTLVSARGEEIKGFVSRCGGKAVVKPLDGAGGAGIFLLRQEDENLNSILETVTCNGSRFVAVQRYLPAIRTDGDKRVILLDGVVLGVTARMPPEGDLRGNIHVGGRCVRARLTPREVALCDAIAPSLRADGLYFVGIDLIGEHLTEVNVTSPTGVQEINALDDKRLEGDVVDFVERQVAQLTA